MNFQLQLYECTYCSRLFPCMHWDFFFYFRRHGFIDLTLFCWTGPVGFRLKAVLYSTFINGQEPLKLGCKFWDEYQSLFAYRGYGWNKNVRFRSEIIFAKIARAKIQKLRTFTSVDFSINLLLNWQNWPITNKWDHYCENIWMTWNFDIFMQKYLFSLKFLRKYV